MKNILLLTGLFLGLVLSASAQNETYKSEDKGYEIMYPTGWNLINNYSAMVSMIAISPKESDTDKFTENINVVVDRTVDLTEITLEHYRDLNLEGIKSMLTKVRIDSVGTDSLPNGTKAGTIIYTHKVEYDIKVLTYFFTKDNVGYVITCSAKKEDFDRYYKLFNELCRSFKFID